MEAEERIGTVSISDIRKVIQTLAESNRAYRYVTLLMWAAACGMTPENCASFAKHGMTAIDRIPDEVPSEV